MAIKKSTDIERPDHTSLQAGSEGVEILQDGQKIVTRGGAPASESDFDIIKDNSGTNWDLAIDGDFNIPGDTPASRKDDPDVGGTVKFAGAIISENNNSFDFTIDWVDDNGKVLVSQKFSSSTGGIDSNHNIKFEKVYTKGDFMQITITDTSGGANNNIHGSINFHT